jgi:hypothetical protein
MTDKMVMPKEIIDYCLKPLAHSAKSEDYKETYRRLEHVIKTYQLEILKAKRPIAIDFSDMKTININEGAHGDD